MPVLVIQDQEIELAPIQHLPDELLMLILGRLGPYSLGHVACVCKHWREMIEVRCKLGGHSLGPCAMHVLCLMHVMLQDHILS